MISHHPTVLNIFVGSYERDRWCQPDKDQLPQHISKHEIIVKILRTADFIWVFTPKIPQTFSDRFIQGVISKDTYMAIIIM